jgi:hypothetical protein
MRTSRSAWILGGCLSAALLTTTMVAPSAQAGTEEGRVVFRVTLQGPVSAAHTFGIRCFPGSTGNPSPCFGVEDIVIVCSPPNKHYDYEPCEPTTYEVVAHAPLGSEITYELLRWTSLDLAHTDDQPEEHLGGSWTVHTGRQVVSLGFLYDGGPPAALANTALPSP